MFTGLPARMLWMSSMCSCTYISVALAGTAVRAAGLLVVPAVAIRGVDHVQRFESADLAGAVRAGDIVVVFVRATRLLAGENETATAVREFIHHGKVIVDVAVFRLDALLAPAERGHFHRAAHP